MDVDRLLRQRALVAEHLHAVDEIADAVGLRADELRQRAVVVLEVWLEQLRGAADARQRVLDLVRQHRGHARYRARRGAMRELALDHLRHERCCSISTIRPGWSGMAPPKTSTSLVHADCAAAPTSTPYSLTVAPERRTWSTSASSGQPKATTSSSVWRFSSAMPLDRNASAAALA